MERPTVSVTEHMGAPAQRVWELVSDIGLLPRFSEELQSVEWVDGDSPATGARFAGTNVHPLMGEWTTQSYVTRYEPPRVFAWAVGDPETPAATWQFDVFDDDGGTTVRYTACIGEGRSGVSMMLAREPDRRDEILASRLNQFERGMVATLRGIKELAESLPLASATSPVAPLASIPLPDADDEPPPAR